MYNNSNHLVKIEIKGDNGKMWFYKKFWQFEV